MDGFTMEIAGQAFRVSPMFQSTIEYCRPYLSDTEPQYHVGVSPEDLIYEQAFLEQEAVEEGLKIRKFKDPFLERSVIQRRVADYLLTHDTLMLHGSTVAVDGKAYLFTAPCGTGKSTHTRLWRELFGNRALMVNDDKPFLRISDDCVWAYGSPWSGKHGLATNICVPLAGICSLHRGTDNMIQRIQSDCVLELLRHQVHIPEDPALMTKAYSLLDILVSRVPLWELHCNKELDAAKVAYHAMSGI